MNGYTLVDAKLAKDVSEYAQLSAAIYEAPVYKPVGEWKMLDAELNCPAGVNLDSTACSWESQKIEPNGDHGFYAEA